VYSYGGFPAAPLPKMGPVVHLGHGWFLKREAEGVPAGVKLVRRVGRVSGDGLGATGFLNVVTEEPELCIRHNEPTQT